MARSNPETRASSNADDIDPAATKHEKGERISTAHKKETKYADLKVCLQWLVGKFTHRQASKAGKIAARFVFSQDGLLYYVGRRRKLREAQEDDIKLRLVMPTTLVDEILLICHDPITGGHQGIAQTSHKVKAKFYWIGLYADVVRHVQTCEDCSTRKRKPVLIGFLPGEMVYERLFLVVSMDFFIPLPKARRGNTALLLL